MPVLPLFIAANFCVLSYEGAITKQLPIFLSVLLIVIICHYIWLTLLYVVASIYSRKNSWGRIEILRTRLFDSLRHHVIRRHLGHGLDLRQEKQDLARGSN